MKIKKIVYNGGDIFTVNVEDVCLKTDNLTLHKYNLSPGLDIDGETFCALTEVSDFICAKDFVASCLSRHASSRSMMDKKLMQKGYSPKTRHAVLDFYEKVGLIDDGLFARDFAKSVSGSRNYGKVRIKAELKKRGVETADIEDALSEVDDTQALREALSKELRKFSDLDNRAIEKIRRRLYMKGFNIWDVNRCLSDIGGENED